MGCGSGLPKPPQTRPTLAVFVPCALLSLSSLSLFLSPPTLSLSFSSLSLSPTLFRPRSIPLPPNYLSTRPLRTHPTLLSTACLLSCCLPATAATSPPATLPSRPPPNGSLFIREPVQPIMTSFKVILLSCSPCEPHPHALSSDSTLTAGLLIHRNYPSLALFSPIRGTTPTPFLSVPSIRTTVSLVVRVSPPPPPLTMLPPPSLQPT